MAACTKQEPPAGSSSAAAKPAPPAAIVTEADQARGNGSSPAAVKLTAPRVLTTATLTTAPATPTESAPIAKPTVPPDDLPSDVSAKAPATAEASAKEGLPSEALAKEGAAIFTQICATCHMADGYGVPYLQPKIKDSAWISNPDPQPLLSLILRGSAILGEASKAYENDMAPQDHLSDTEIAAVASYVRRRFAVTPITEPVTPAQVALARNRPGLP